MFIIYLPTERVTRSGLVLWRSDISSFVTAYKQICLLSTTNLHNLNWVIGNLFAILINISQCCFLSFLNSVFSLTPHLSARLSQWRRDVLPWGLYHCMYLLEILPLGGRIFPINYRADFPSSICCNSPRDHVRVHATLHSDSWARQWVRCYLGSR